MNWNENTLGPSPKAIEGAKAGLLDANRYALGGLLTPLVAEYLGIDQDWILMGTGSTELQRLAPISHLRDGGNVVSSLETWLGGLSVAEAMGIAVKRLKLLKEKGYAFDIEGMLDLRPLTVKCPWRMSCRASAREVAKPIRKTTLSNRRSSRTRRFAPARPLIRVARCIVLANCFSSSPYMRFTFCFSRSWTPKSEKRERPCPCCPGG